MEHLFFHIDVNSAFLSWSALSELQKGNPVDIRTIPSIVGGDSDRRHGIVLAKSIPAKKYGIETAETVASAFRKCPNLVMVPPDMYMYRDMSRSLMAYLSGINPEIEQVSVDECYMNATPLLKKYKNPVDAADMIRAGVRDTFGFTVNIGVSDRKVLAKMASDFQKPDRTHTLFASEISEKMWPLPVSSLFFCGKSSVAALKKLEILTIGDLATADPSIIELHLKSHGRLLWQFANGIDDSVVVTENADTKGVGNSTTLPHDIDSPEEISKTLLHLADSVATRLRKYGKKASMVNCEIRYADFHDVSHQMLLPRATDDAGDLHTAACKLFSEIWDGSPVRLLGIRTSKLSERSDPVQMTIFDYAHPEEDAKKRKLNEALDSIRNKYGKDAVTRGTFLPPQS